MIHTVFDTNTLVAAFINPNGYPAQLISAWRRAEFQLIISPAVMEEYRRTLVLPEIRVVTHRSEAEIDEQFAEIASRAIMVLGALDLRVIDKDPTDDKFFVAAVEGEANYIVTKEQAWKKLKAYRGIRIVSPSKFHEILLKLKKN